MSGLAGDPGRRRGPFGPGLLLVLATALVSGVSTFVNLYAVRGTSSDAFVTVRNLAVVAFLAPLGVVAAFRRGPRPGLARRDLGALVLVGLVGGAVPFLLFFHGLSLAAADHGGTTASFVYRTLFLFAGLFAVLFLGERLSRRYVAGALLLLLGSYLLLSITAAQLTEGSLYVLAATGLWAGEYTLSKRLLARLPSTTLALGRMGFGAAFLGAYLAFTAQWSAVLSFSGGQWEWVGISAVLLTAFVTTWYAGLARVELSVASSVLVLGYPVSWLLASLAGGGPLSVRDAAGSLAVLAGAGLIVGVAYLRGSWAWVRRVTASESSSS